MQLAPMPTRFERWVAVYGVSRCARELNLARSTVHRWLSGRRPVGKRHADKIIALAGGLLTEADIREQYELRHRHAGATPE